MSHSASLTTPGGAGRGSVSAPSDEMPPAPVVTGGGRDATWPRVERRSGRDRRSQPTRWYDSFLGHRRRRRGRRRGESRNVYVDIYHVHDLMLVALVFVLNLFDAGMTLGHLASGGSEANPIMDVLLDKGHAFFLLQKIVVVGLCLMIVIVHKNFKLARYSAYLLLTLYGALAGYHFVV